jgi:hypothetical protein
VTILLEIRPIAQSLNHAGFHPETALFRHGGVNLQACLCGVPMYVSAQSLDFLAMTKNCSFPN